MKNKSSIGKGILRSEFDQEEDFDIKNVPSHFGSVTNDSLQRLQDSAVDSVEVSTDFKPGALKMALKGVDGLFENAYVILEGDYNTRRNNLNIVYTSSISDLRKNFKTFELQVEEHNVAYDKYSEANAALNGSPLAKSLRFSEEELKKLKDAIDSLGKDLENA